MSDEELEEQLDVIGQRVTETWIMVARLRGLIYGIVIGLIITSIMYILL